MKKSKFFGLGIYIASVTVLLSLLCLITPSRMNGGLDAALGVLFFFPIVACVYLLPSFAAAANEKRNLIAITVLNTLLGWTVLGFIICLIWGLKKDDSTTVVVHATPPVPNPNPSLEQQLVELKSLRDRELLTEDEYQAKRIKLIS